MEKINLLVCIIDHHITHCSAGHKPQLMNLRIVFNRLIIFGFMIVVGFCIAKGIYYQSVWGISLACISLGAGIYFLHLLAKAKQDAEQEETA
jgi:hypothetical protein